MSLKHVTQLQFSLSATSRLRNCLTMGRKQRLKQGDPEPLENLKKDVKGKGLSGYAPVQGRNAVTCFVETIVKPNFGLDPAGTLMNDCIRYFEGVVPYPGV